MKKHIIFTAIALSLVVVASAQSKVAFGIRSGLDMNTLSQITSQNEGNVTHTYNGYGLSLGGVLDIRLTDTTYCHLRYQYYIETGLFFADRSIGIDSSISRYYVEIPLLASFKWNLRPQTNPLKLLLQMGPTVGIGVAGDKGAFDDTRRVNVYLTTGLGLEWRHFYIADYIHLGLSNMAKHSKKNYRETMTATSLAFGWKF